MNHTGKRFSLGLLGAIAIGSTLAAIYPRVYAWNVAASSAVIASQRAANCRVLIGNLQPNSIPLDQKGKPLPPGTHVCDWQGLTGQITAGNAIGYVKQGDSKAIAEILKSRGFKQP
ncbi:hypothetical protein ACN4EG_25210 [Alkalinema pantanalense CENA528]|uniref:hypothetical protein n=1 Tax=Alkalinema pantanalense TaxID=1620705 RepID=UPI003D6E4B81